jgi:hypothetical protein
MVVAEDGPASPQSSQASPQHSSDGARTDEMVVAEDGWADVSAILPVDVFGLS